MDNYENMSDLFLNLLKKYIFPDDSIKLDLKFSKSEFFTMMLIDKKVEITMTELSEYINSPLNTATGIVDRLVKSGYIKRDRSETDRRVVLIQFTEKGSDEVKKVKELISKYFNIILKDLTAKEKMFLFSILLKVMNNLQNDNPVST